MGTDGQALEVQEGAATTARYRWLAGVDKAHVMESAMLKGNQWNKNVPRVEYDHRAREARLRLIQLERRLVSRDAVKAFGVFRRVRLLDVSIAGGRSGDDSTESLSDQWPSDTSMAAGRAS
jgi:hypothetical protein